MTPWARAGTALQLLAVDPIGLGGIALRARVGPARDAFVAALTGLGLDIHRLHPALQADEIDGGIDVAGSLGGGTLVARRGILDRGPTIFVLPMAERTTPFLASRLSAMAQAQSGHILIALDEGAEPDETLPTALQDPLAFHVSLGEVSQSDITPVDFPHGVTARAVRVPDTATEEIVALAVRLGIDSLRAPTLALRAARAHAAIQGRSTVEVDDILIAAELVLAPRATRLPQPEEPEPEPEQNEPETPKDTPPSETLILPDEILLAAIATALPPDVLQAGTKANRASSGSGAGARKQGNRRGRPLPPRASGAPGANARVDLFATLRAAVPWQRLRAQQYPTRTGAIILPQDLRHKRYLDLSDRLLIFAVDASGSSAVSRLAEAKGAVELLLAEAYAKRDHVSLIAFRGTKAETLLPPTRSLVQTKRRLADLPGGGGTPLAAGLRAGLDSAQQAVRKGLSPTLIVLTDGRGNIALDGTANRVAAGADATLVATHLRASGVETIVIDTSNRPDTSLKTLAAATGGRYIPLPRADARKLSQAVSDALEV